MSEISKVKLPSGDIFDIKATRAELVGQPTAPTANAGVNNTQIATTAFVHTAVNSAVASAARYIGTINAVSELATDAKKGDFYRVATEWSGVHVGDIIIAEKDNPTQTIDGTNWSCLHNELDTDTTYTFQNGVNQFVVTPSDGAPQTVTITPAIVWDETYNN